MKKKKLPPLRETPQFQELLDELKKQTPEQLERLKDYLEKIKQGSDGQDEKA